MEHDTPKGPEEMCLSLGHQTRRKPLKKWVILIALQSRYTFYRPKTKRLRARKIGLFFNSALRASVALRSTFRQRVVLQRGYGLRLLIFKVANNKVDLGQIRSEEIVYTVDS